MIDDKDFERLAPLACEWARAQEASILEHGVPLTVDQIADARRAGVRDPGRIRVLVVDRIPLPEDKELADAARRAHIITEASHGVTIGHGLIIRADNWRNRELLIHQFAHVAQCERSGGLQTFVSEYLRDRRSSRDFSLGPLEEEARTIARKICAADQAAKSPA
jgi:hypothetical protein